MLVACAGNPALAILPVGEACRKRLPCSWRAPKCQARSSLISRPASTSDGTAPPPTPIDLNNARMLACFPFLNRACSLPESSLLASSNRACLLPEVYMVPEVLKQNYGPEVDVCSASAISTFSSTTRAPLAVRALQRRQQATRELRSPHHGAAHGQRGSPCGLGRARRALHRRRHLRRGAWRRHARPALRRGLPVRQPHGICNARRVALFCS